MYLYVMKENIVENILRIQELMENNPNKKMESYQKLIDSTIFQMKNICETMNDAENEYIFFDACDIINSDIKVLFREIIKHEDYKEIVVDITYKNYQHITEHSFAQELGFFLSEIMGKTKVTVGEFTNTFPDEQRQW